MKLIQLIAVLAAVPAIAGNTMAQRLAEAKAACPDCYRVIVTNGVCVGMNRVQYMAYEAFMATNRVIHIRTPLSKGKSLVRRHASKRTGLRGYQPLVYPKKGKK